MASIVDFVSNVLFRPVESYCSFGPTVNELTLGLLGYSFRPECDINDLSGKVVFVTGGKCLLSWFIRCTILTCIVGPQETPV